MRSCSCLVAAVILVAVSGLSGSQSLSAHQQVIATTGDAVPGVPGAKLLAFDAPTLNGSGQVAFSATLADGFGGVSLDSNRAVWFSSSNGNSVVARSGSGSVPGSPGASYADFSRVSLDDAGNVGVRASLQTVGATTADNNQGIWRLSAGGGSQVARTGASNVPGVSPASFESLGFELLHAPANVLAMNGRMVLSPPGVEVSNDRGIWLDVSGTQSLLAREQTSAVPGAESTQFSSVSAESVNDAGQVAVLGALLGGPGVDVTNLNGLWRLGLNSQLVARQGVTAVPGAAGASFQVFQNPRVNQAGAVAFNGTLAPSGSINDTNNFGLWVKQSNVLALIARTGVGGVPDLGGAKFASIGEPLLNDAGQVAFSGTLEIGSGGITSTTSRGLWVGASGAGALIAQSGVTNVPGAPSARFSEFHDAAFNAAGFIAVEADLIVGAGGVTPSNQSGIWLLSSNGSGVEVARAGSVIAGRTIASVDLLGGSGGGDGLRRSLNDMGQVAFRAIFTSGEEAAMLFTPDLASGPADFTGDGAVNGADLARWRSNFGMSSTAAKSHGDADGDHDVDGADFLTWQRQLSPSALPVTSEVPEPSAATLLIAFGVVLMRRRRPRVHI